ncbi:MAG: glycosyltransferase family 2 protein [Phycisphaerales bacterium]|nr:glycosyltransferase family 2 protein [Phycisphaerae bacterium]NNF43095.1 glycosyltransferase family 2 protein [Phycisphaerales bacterium]NNM27351.1 glycosyltransferase family 2 protein [Phycisphaerales bacterium]
MRCDLIIPALDEEANIDPLFDAIDTLGPDRVRHVVLADNDSRDATATRAAARGAIVVTETHRGYGAVCLRAMQRLARINPPPEVVVFLDADLADDPSHLPDLVTPIERGDADLVIGSRVRHAAPGALSLVQRFGNGLACRLIALATGKHPSDLGPFRAVRWTTLQRLAMADRTWGWTVEMQMKAALLDIPVAEVDVPYRRRHAGRSKISGTVRGVVTAGSKIIATIGRLWWQRDLIRVAAAAHPDAAGTVAPVAANPDATTTLSPPPAPPPSRRNGPS